MADNQVHSFLRMMAWPFAYLSAVSWFPQPTQGVLPWDRTVTLRSLTFQKGAYFMTEESGGLPGS